MLTRARRNDHGEKTKLDAEEGDSGAEIEVGCQEGNEDEGKGRGEKSSGREEGACGSGSGGPGNCAACCHDGLKGGLLTSYRRLRVGMRSLLLEQSEAGWR